MGRVLVVGYLQSEAASSIRNCPSQQAGRGFNHADPKWKSFFPARRPYWRHSIRHPILSSLHKCVCASMSTSIDLWERPAILRPLSRHDAIQVGDFSGRILKCAGPQRGKRAGERSIMPANYLAIFTLARSRPSLIRVCRVLLPVVVLSTSLRLAVARGTHLLLLQMIAHVGHHEPRFTFSGVAFHRCPSAHRHLRCVRSFT